MCLRGGRLERPLDQDVALSRVANLGKVFLKEVTTVQGAERHEVRVDQEDAVVGKLARRSCLNSSEVAEACAGCRRRPMRPAARPR